MEAPEVRLHQWIRVGTTNIYGLVLDIYSKDALGVGVYQNKLKAIKDDVIWDGTRWEFKYSGPSGSYLHGAEESMVKAGPWSASGT